MTSPPVPPPCDWPVPMPSIGAQNILTLPGGVTHAGYLHKKGGTQVAFMAWPLRYIVLHCGCLYYYKSSTSTLPRGCFSLRGYNRVMRALEETSAGKVFPFKILHRSAQHRTWCFSAANERERKVWMAAIRNEIEKYMNHNPTSSRRGSDDSDSFYQQMEKPLPSLAQGDCGSSQDGDYDDYDADDDNDEDDYLEPDDYLNPDLSKDGDGPMAPLKAPAHHPPTHHSPTPTNPPPRHHPPNPRSPTHHPPTPTNHPPTNHPPASIKRPALLPPKNRLQHSTHIHPHTPSTHTHPPTSDPLPPSAHTHPPTTKAHPPTTKAHPPTKHTHPPTSYPLPPTTHTPPPTTHTHPPTTHPHASTYPPHPPTKPPPLPTSATHRLPPTIRNKPTVPPKPGDSSKVAQLPGLAVELAGLIGRLPQHRRNVSGCEDDMTRSAGISRQQPDGESFRKVRSDSDNDDYIEPEDIMPDSIFLDTSCGEEAERRMRVAGLTRGLYCIRNSATSGQQVLVVWDEAIGKTRNFKIFQTGSQLSLEMGPGPYIFTSLAGLLGHYHSSVLPRQADLKLALPLTT